MLKTVKMEHIINFEFLQVIYNQTFYFLQVIYNQTFYFIKLVKLSFAIKMIAFT